MDKLWPTLLIVVILALVFIGMWIGWRRRARRDSALTVPTVLDEPGAPIMTTEALYVASTYHDKPLDRVVVAGLAFRARATVTVSTGGVSIQAPGESSVAIAASVILGVGAATWTIDRTVERDGLVLLAWSTVPTDADGAVLDTYLRITDPEQRRRLVEGIRSITDVDTTAPSAGGADPDHDRSAADGADTTTDQTTGSEA